MRFKVIPDVTITEIETMTVIWNNTGPNEDDSVQSEHTHRR